MARPPRNFVENRRRLIRAAFEVFSRKGYRVTTMKDIAREAKLTPPAIYHYFRSKDEILLAVVQGHIPTLTYEDLVKALPLHGDPKVVLLDLARLVRDELSAPDSPKFYRLVLSEAISSPGLLAEVAPRLSKEFGSFLIVYLDGQIKAGRLREADFAEMVLAFMKPVFCSAVTERILFPDSPPDESALDVAVRRFLETYAPPEAKE